MVVGLKLPLRQYVVRRGPNKTYVSPKYKSVDHISFVGNL